MLLFILVFNQHKSNFYFFFLFAGGVQIWQDFAIVAKLALLALRLPFSLPYKMKIGGGGGGGGVFIVIPPRASIVVSRAPIALATPCTNTAAHCRTRVCQALSHHCREPQQLSLPVRALHQLHQSCPALVSPFPQQATARPAPAVPWPSRGLPWSNRALVQPECARTAFLPPAVSPALPLCHFLTTDMVRTRGGSRFKPTVRFSTLEMEESAPTAVPKEP